MIYCDTSVIVSAITNEGGTAAAQQWLRERESTSFAFSAWTETEIASALAMKQRRAVLDEAGRHAAFDQWKRLSLGWQRLAVEDRHFARAATLTSLGLRAGDALHLAIAVEAQSELVTSDVALAEGGRKQGLVVHQPG